MSDVTYDEALGVYNLLGSGGKTSAYSRFLGCVAWGNPVEQDPELALHGLVVGGAHSDGTFRVLREFQGQYHQAGTDRSIVNEMIALKDRFLVRAYYVEPEPAELVRGLRDPWINPRADGLAVYGTAGINVVGQPIYMTPLPGVQWPTYRDRSTVAEIILVAEPIRTDLPGQVARVNNIIAAGKVGVDKKRTPKIERWSQELPREAYKHPLFRALVYLVAIWDHTNIPQSHRHKQTPPQAHWW